ncbi:MAG: peptidase S8, partial [Spirochaetia bacterium]
SREEGEESPGTASASDHWELGVNLRNRGSIHSDIWHGTASELASSNIIAVFPRTGWWKERAYLEKWDKQARYSLIVSIRTPEETVDIYTPVASKIGIGTPIEITT